MSTPFLGSSLNLFALASYSVRYERLNKIRIKSPEITCLCNKGHKTMKRNTSLPDRTTSHCYNTKYMHTAVMHLPGEDENTVD
jgi:hypothetical protein